MERESAGYDPCGFLLRVRDDANPRWHTGRALGRQATVAVRHLLDVGSDDPHTALHAPWRLRGHRLHPHTGGHRRGSIGPLAIIYVFVYLHTHPFNGPLSGTTRVSLFCAFSALALFVGRQEGHPARKNRVVGCWRGYLSGARCRLAYGPADATVTHCLLLQ